MRFVHTADLHIGRRLGQLPLADDASFMLDELHDLVVSRSGDALVVAGDVFDAPVPPEWAVRMWDSFVECMAAAGVTLLVVGGNHDSGARLAYGSSLVAAAGVHVVGEFTGEVPCVEVGGVTFWLVPFVRPADVRAWAASMGHEVVGPLDYDAAVRLVLDSVRERPEYAASSANVAVAHQFVTASGAAPTRCDSERLSLGTLDNVDVSAFDGFDYVALGHVHGPQRVGRDTVRYAGSPLKYSASEIDQRKSFAVVDVEPGEVPSVELVPMAPLHGFRRERGGFDELLDRGRGEDEATRADFVQAVVTDDEEPVDVAARLRAVWPDLVGVEFDNARTNAAGARSVAEVEATTADVAGLFSDFFDQQVGRAMSDSERQVMRSAMAEDRGEDPHGEVAAGTYAAGGVVA